MIKYTSGIYTVWFDCSSVASAGRVEPSTRTTDHNVDRRCFERFHRRLSKPRLCRRLTPCPECSLILYPYIYSDCSGVAFLSNVYSIFLEALSANLMVSDSGKSSMLFDYVLECFIALHIHVVSLFRLLFITQYNV